MFIKFFHHLFSPHCPECSLEKECKTCDTLRSILEQERFEKKKLLEQIIEMSKPQIEYEVSRSQEEIKPLRPVHVPWRIKQQELEEADRAKARIMKDREKQIGSDVVKNKSIEELEKQLDIEEKEDAS